MPLYRAAGYGDENMQSSVCFSFRLADALFALVLCGSVARIPGRRMAG